MRHKPPEYEGNPDRHTNCMKFRKEKVYEVHFSGMKIYTVSAKNRNEAYILARTKLENEYNRIEGSPNFFIKLLN